MKRWRSRRGRPQNNDSPAQNTPSSRGEDFDFAFSKRTSPAPASFTTVTGLHSKFAYDARPTTAGGLVEGRAAKDSKLIASPRRPQSSGGSRLSTQKPSHRASRSVDDLIGLAFGSPNHPPMAFRNLAAPLGPPDDSRIPIKGRSNSNGKKAHNQPKAWKKIGALFRGRAAYNKSKDQPMEQSPAIAQVEQTNAQHRQFPRRTDSKLSPRALDQPTRCPPPIPHEVESKIEPSKPQTGTSVLLDATPPSSAEPAGPARQLIKRPARTSSLPRLEVDIPGKPIHPQAVKVHNLPAASRSSSLLARRNKAVGSITASTDTSRNASTSTTEQMKVEAKPVAEHSEVPQTIPKPSFAATKQQDSPPTVSKYSLFPARAPAPIKIVGRVPFESPLKWSATSPAKLSPMQDTFPMAKVQPLNPSRKISEENPLSSPEEQTASTDQTNPWSTNHSLQSSVSSSTTMEEIFFDIKSFRDSKGIEDNQQFVINRPDSAVVQLARTRSKVNAATRSHKQGTEPPPTKSQATLTALRNELLDKHGSVNSVNTAVFDEVIAAVEQLGTPSKAKQTLNRENAASPPAKPALGKSDLEMKLLPPDPVLPARSPSTARRDQVQRMMPSPVLEEVSPLSKKSLSPQENTNTETSFPTSATKQTSQDLILEESVYNTKVALAGTPRKSSSRSKKPSIEEDLTKPPHFAAVASLKRVDTPIEDSPTIPQGPPPRKPVPIAHDHNASDRPPPVPEKDARFVPISKFAAKNTIVKVEQAQAGIRPARPIRSATDTIVSFSPQLSQRTYSSPKIGARPERSATIPMPQAQQPRKSPQPSNLAFVSQASVHPSKKDAPPVAAVIHAAPTAEVSVARTVSLSRKQSAKVLVPGPKLAARRAAERAREGGADSGADTPSTIMSISAANSPAIGCNSPTTQQEPVRPQVVDVKPKEITVKPNPLRSNPSPSSIVVTELPAMLGTAGIAPPVTQEKPFPEPQGPSQSKPLPQPQTQSDRGPQPQTAKTPELQPETTPEPQPSKASEEPTEKRPELPWKPTAEDADKQRAREKIKKMKEQAREKIAFDAEMEEKRRGTPDTVRTETSELTKNTAASPNCSIDIRVSVESDGTDASKQKMEMETASLKGSISNEKGSVISGNGLLISDKASIKSEKQEIEREEKLAAQERDREMIAKYKETDKTKWDLIDRNRALSPVVMEGERRYGHKQGLSVGIVLESA